MGVGPELAREKLEKAIVHPYPSPVRSVYDVLCDMVLAFGRDVVDAAMATVHDPVPDGTFKTYVCQCECHIVPPSITVRSLDEFFTHGWEFVYIVTPEGRWHSSPRCPKCMRGEHGKRTQHGLDSG